MKKTDQSRLSRNAQNEYRSPVGNSEFYVSRPYEQQTQQADYLVNPHATTPPGGRPPAPPPKWDLFRPPDHTPLARDSPYTKRDNASASELDFSRRAAAGTGAGRGSQASPTPAKTNAPVRDAPFMPPGHLTRNGSSNSLLRVKSKTIPDRREEGERKLVDPHVVRDVIIGLSDGLTVPFALTAGLSSLGDSKLVILGGVAELIAGAISMGVGGFLAAQSERDHARYLRQRTHQRIMLETPAELEREVHGVLGPVGVDEYLSRQLAIELRGLEGANGAPKRGHGSDSEKGDTKSGPGDEVGLTAFIMKFSEGVEEMSTLRMYISAFTIGMGYLIGGIIPLLPYFFEKNVKTALIISSVITGVTLLIFGVVKTHITGAKGGFKGYAWGAISTLLVGGAAAAAAYGITAALEKKTDAVNSCSTTSTSDSQPYIIGY